MIGYLHRFLVLALISLVGFSGCGPDKKEPPPQDHFRLLTVRLNQVQDAVASRAVSSIDSLLIPDLRDEPEGVDSLLHFVYGVDPDFQFKSFANYQIFHTHDKARVDVEITGPDSIPGQRATLTFELIPSFKKEPHFLQNFFFSSLGILTRFLSLIFLARAIYLLLLSGFSSRAFSACSNNW